MKIEIIPFKVNDHQAFYDLNVEWLNTYFYVEPYDEEVLSNPKKYIIDKGGHIFYAKLDANIIGTVALMPTAEKGTLELSKMAVYPKSKGIGIGQRLMQHCITFALEQGVKKLILYSNTRLENAIHIYRKYGFKEIPIETDSPYVRSDIKMILELIP